MRVNVGRRSRDVYIPTLPRALHRNACLSRPAAAARRPPGVSSPRHARTHASTAPPPSPSPNPSCYARACVCTYMYVSCRWPGHVHHPEVAAGRVRLRGRHVHSRPWPGGASTLTRACRRVLHGSVAKRVWAAFVSQSTFRGRANVAHGMWRVDREHGAAGRCTAESALVCPGGLRLALLAEWHARMMRHVGMPHAEVHLPCGRHTCRPA